MTEPTAGERWDDDTPITSAQYAGIWDSAMVVQECPSYSKHVVRKLLAEVDRLREQLGTHHVQWGVRAEGSTAVFPARSEANAREQAEIYSRIHEPGCRPVPHHVVMRPDAEWREAPKSPPHE